MFVNSRNYISGDRSSDPQIVVKLRTNSNLFLQKNFLSIVQFKIKGELFLQNDKNKNKELEICGVHPQSLCLFKTYLKPVASVGDGQK